MLTKAIIFDFDDTLVRSRGDRSDLLVEALAAFGHIADREVLHRVWGSPFEEMVSAAAPGVRGFYRKFLSFYANFLLRYPPTPAPGLHAAISNLVTKAVLIVHSSSDGLLVRTDLESLGTLRYFSFVSGSDLHRHAKPNPESLSLIDAFLTRISAGNCMSLYVGNARADSELARAAGIPFVGVNYGWGDASDFTTGSPSFPVMKSLDELPQIVDTLV